MKNILDEILEELLSEFDLSIYSQIEIEGVKKNILDDLYGKIILKAIGTVSLDDKELFLTELRNGDGDMDSVFHVINEFISNPEEMIAEVMIDFKQDLAKYFNNLRRV